MNSKVLIVIGIIMTFFACSNDDTTTDTSIEGQYSGIFERNGEIVNIELNFNNDLFNGQSEIYRFPLICNGGYEISETIIEFENQCIWTADFDWTLILSGEWNYNLNSNILTLTKENGDKYTLTKQ